MKVFLQYKFVISALLAIVFLYFFIRLPELVSQPIFADEAIYVRWAQVMRSEPTLRFVSLSDGKTPLFMWLMIPMFKVFDDPLFAGRLLSVISGLATLMGVFVLASRLFSLRVGLWSAFIYAITPYTVFFDRMALVDSMLATFTIWSMVFAVWLLRSQRLDIAMFLGYFLGGAMLVKTPAMMNLLALLLTIVGFNFQKKNRSDLLKLLGLWVTALVIALVIYNTLRLGPGFSQLSSRNADYVFSPLELVGRPLDPFIPHLNDLIEWFPLLITWPILIVIAAGLIFVAAKKKLVALAIILWLLVPLILQMTFLKTFTARYILTSIPPLLLFAGFGIENILLKFKKSYAFSAGVMLLLLIPMPLYYDYLIVKDVQNANLPKNERRGYLEDWTAGYGFPEIAKYLIERSKIEPIVVGTEGSFGTLPDGLYIYLDKANIPIVGGGATVSAALRESAQTKTTFFVSNKNRLQKGVENAQLILEFPKAVPLGGKPQDAIILYQIFPNNLGQE